MRKIQISKPLCTIMILVFLGILVHAPVKSFNIQNQQLRKIYSSYKEKDSSNYRVFSCKNVPTNVLIFAGQTNYAKVTSGLSGNQFWFKSENMYDVSLYLSKMDIEKINEVLRKKSLEDLIAGDKVHQDIVYGSFPKAIVLKFGNSFPSLRVRDDIAQNIKNVININSPDVKMFLNYTNFVIQEFKEDDEIIIYFLGDGRISTTVCNQELPIVQNKMLARIILGIWVGKDKLSSKNPGLLTSINNPH